MQIISKNRLTILEECEKEKNIAVERAFAGGFLMGAGKKEGPILTKLATIQYDYNNFILLNNEQ